MTGPLYVGAMLLQGALVVLLLVAVRRRDTAVAVNAAVAFGAAMLPAAVETATRVAGRDVVLGPELALWITAAGFLHSLGMVGLYESVGWWDHLTHTVSAALLAALVYASIVLASHPGGSGPVTVRTGVVTVLVVLALGVFWEVMELVARAVGERYGVEPVLVHYGWWDTALDLVFDLVGALAVVAIDLRVFVPIAEQFPHVARTLVPAVAVAAVVGSVLLVPVVRAAGHSR